MIRNGVTYYLLHDIIGSLRGVIDASGTMVKRMDYDSFGNIINDTNPSFTIPFGFAGGLQDQDIGLVRFGARDYDPALGRWTAKDPIDFTGGDVNLYGYVQNDPVNWVDPEGLEGIGTVNVSPNGVLRSDNGNIIGELGLEDPWIDPTILMPGVGAAGKCALKVEVKFFTGSNIFKIISKRLKMGFRIDWPHHGKNIHKTFWRW
jgi:RHS repeat-associated protein